MTNDEPNDHAGHDTGHERSPYQPTPYGPTPYGHQSEAGGPHTGEQGWLRPGGGQPPAGAYGAPYAPPGPPPPPPPSPGHRFGLGRFIAALLVLLLVGVIGGAVGAGVALGTHHDSASLAQVASPVSASRTPNQPLAKVAAAVQPSVVSITVTTSQGGDEGSGVVLTKDGTILTNNHVVAAAANGGGSVQVKFANGKSARATIVGRDPSNDLAVIKVTGVSGLSPATLGSSDSLHVGDTVLAIGSPLGLEGSVSAGIVSALHRSVATSGGSPGEGGQQQSAGGSRIDDAIQTDAAINPGNSGGPLVNMSGEVVGIDTAIASLSQGQGQSGNIGVGFAIPAAQVKKDLPDLEQGRQPQHAVLGVQVTDAPSGGALLDGVVPGSAAAKAGLRAGDVITKFAGTPISGADGLGAAVRDHKPGDTLTVAVVRGGQQQQVRVTLGGGT